MDEAKDLARTTEPSPAQDTRTEAQGSEVDLPDLIRELLLEITRRLADPTHAKRFMYIDRRDSTRIPHALAIIDSPDGMVHFSLMSADEGSDPTTPYRYISLDFLNENTRVDGGIRFSDVPSDIPNKQPWTIINEEPASDKFIEVWKARGGNHRKSPRSRSANRDEILGLTRLLKDGHPNMEMMETVFRNSFSGFTAEEPAVAPPTPTPLSRGVSRLYHRLRG